MKKKNIQRDFAAAALLNERLTVPSTCFELSNLPEVKYICCHEDVFAQLLAEQLQTALRKNGIDAEIIMSEEFKYLRMKKPDIQEWLHFSKAFGAYAFDPQECLLICTEAAAKAIKATCYGKAYFAVADWLRKTNLSQKYFILSGDEHYGLRRLKNADFVVCYDDDVTSAFQAAQLWWSLSTMYGDLGPSGCRRKFLCVGGKGVMSGLLYKELMAGEERQTEGMMLRKTALMLWLSPEDIIVCDNGNNTGENLREMAETIGDKTAIVAVTQRLSLVLYMSQKKQQPQLKLDYFVIWQDLSDTCQYLNGMRFCSSKPILHYWAHVLRRWYLYADAKYGFMLPVYGVDQETKEAAEQLERKYVVKQRNSPLKAFLQMLPFMAVLLFYSRRARQEYNITVRQWRRQLRIYGEATSLSRQENAQK